MALPGIVVWLAKVAVTLGYILLEMYNFET